jgi:hypothetical protein
MAVHQSGKALFYAGLPRASGGTKACAMTGQDEVIFFPYDKHLNNPSNAVPGRIVPGAMGKRKAGQREGSMHAFAEA